MKYLKKTCALTLSAAMAISMVSAAGNVSYAAGNVEKEETVYVNQDADGTVDEITVSDWLKNVAGKEDISDVSNLTDIENPYLESRQRRHLLSGKKQCSPACGRKDFLQTGRKTDEGFRDGGQER